jgi:predicted Zn-dependent peptidase
MMPLRRLAPLLVLLLLGCATTRPLDPRSFHPPPLRFEPPEPRQAQLSGGARVFLLEDHDVPLVRVYLSFRGGSVYDPPDKAGLAQVAALAWRTGGTRSLSPEAVDEGIESRALEVNLSLGRDKGWASLSALTGDLDEGLSRLAEILLHPAFREDRVAWAATQVAERIRREADDPESLAFRELRRALYRGHPRGVIATQESVGEVTRDDVVGLHRRLLEEGAWVIGAVGDFDPDALLGTLERLLGRLPGAGGGFPPLPPPAEPEPRLVVIPKPLPQSTVVWARFGPKRTAPEFYALDLADYLLGGSGFQSILMREIRSDRGLAYSVGSFYDAYPEFGVLGLRAATKKESTAEVLTLLRSLADRAAVEGFPGGDVAEAKEALANRHVFRYVDPANAVQEAMSLRLDGLPADLPSVYLPRMLALTPDQVAAASRAYYRSGPGIAVIVGDVNPKDPAFVP